MCDILGKRQRSVCTAATGLSETENPLSSFVGLIDNIQLRFTNESNLQQLYQTLVNNTLTDTTTLEKHKSERVVKLFEEMESRGIEPTLPTYHAVMRSLKHLKQSNKLLAILEQMKTLGIADITAYNITISNFTETNPEIAESIWNDLNVNSPITPTIVTFNLLAHMYHYHKSEKKFLNLFQQISDIGLLPNLATYKILIQRYSKDVEMVESFWNLLLTQGIQPTMEVYTMVTRVYADTKNSEKFEKLVAEICEKALTLDTLSFYAIVNGFLELGRVEDALNWGEDNLDRWIEYVMAESNQKDADSNLPSRLDTTPLVATTAPKSFRHDPLRQIQAELMRQRKDRRNFRNGAINRLYTRAISACNNSDEVAKVPRIFLRYRKSNATPDLQIFTSYAHALFQLGSFMELKDLYDEINARNLSMDAILSNIMLLTFAKIQDFKTVLDIFGNLKRCGAATTFTYDTILSIFASCSRYSGAIKFFETEMRTKENLEPTLASYTIVANACLRMGNPRGAMNYLESALQNKNIVFDTHAWAVYFSILGQLEPSMKMMEKTLNLMSSQEVKPTLYIYTALMKIYVESGKHEEALLMLQHLQKKGPKPDLVTYTMLLSVFGKRNRMESVWHIYRLLNDEGFTPDVCLWEVLLRAQLDSGDIVTVNAVLQQFRQQSVFPFFTAKFLGQIYNFYKYQKDEHMIHWVLAFGVPITIAGRQERRLLDNKSSCF